MYPTIYSAGQKLSTNSLHGMRLNSLRYLLIGRIAHEKVQVIGRTTTETDLRAPTFSIKVEGHSSEKIANTVTVDKIAVRHGDFYARRLVTSVGIDDFDDGVVRCSMAHYNTVAEVEAPDYCLR